jgi:hypothetical protein
MAEKERYQRISEKLCKLACFVDVHQCGYPSRYYPVNLYARAANGVGLYIGQGFGRKTTDWSIEYTYNPKLNTRSDMNSISGIRTQKEMLQVVASILRGDYRWRDKTIDHDTLCFMVNDADRVEFEDSWDNEAYDETTMWFTAPVEFLPPKKYPDAKTATISVTYPLGKPEQFQMPIKISPCDGETDYDWQDFKSTANAVTVLLKKAGVLKDEDVD